MLRIVRGCAVAAALAAGCGYPSFDFATGKTSTGKTTSTATATGTAGGGGAGGAGSGGAGGGAGGVTASGGAGGATTGTGGHAGAPPEPTVECSDGNDVCAVGEVCCYHSHYFSCDHCAAPGACLPYSSIQSEPCDVAGDKYYKLACARSADCDAGTVCCGTVVDGQSGKIILGTVCAKSCDQPDNYVMCIKGSDCPSTPCNTADYGSYGYCN